MDGICGYYFGGSKQGDTGGYPYQEIRLRGVSELCTCGGYLRCISLQIPLGMFEEEMEMLASAHKDRVIV